MKNALTIWFVMVALSLNLIGVFSIGSALDVVAGFGGPSLDPLFREISAVLGVACIALALRFWLRVFKVENL